MGSRAASGRLPAMDWLADAACAGEDPELFFPVSDAGPSAEQADAAREVCRRCPVRGPCLSWALETGQTSGVWGGTLADERRSRLRARRGA